MSNCTSCNKELALNAKYCKFCGVSQAVKSHPISDASLAAKKDLPTVCIKCDHELIAHAKFCKVCGTKISTEPIAELPITETSKTATVNPTKKIKKTKPQAEGKKVDFSAKSILSKAVVTDVLKSKPIPINTLLVILGLITIVGIFYFSQSYFIESRLLAAKVAKDKALKEKAEADAGLPDVNLRNLILAITPNLDDDYTAPSPLMVKNAVKPCSVKVDGWDISVECDLRWGGEYLVEDNLYDNRKVSIQTTGARSMVFTISFSATFPNHIHRVMDNEVDWNINTLDCPSKKQGGAMHNIVFTAQPPGKRKFAFKTSSSYGSGGEWGTLTLYLIRIDDGAAVCDIVDLDVD